MQTGYNPLGNKFLSEYERSKKNKKRWVVPPKEVVLKQDPQGTVKPHKMGELNKIFCKEIFEAAKTKDVNRALAAYHKLDYRRADLRVYTALLKVLNQRDLLGEALEIYGDIKYTRQKPNIQTVSNLLDVCVTNRHLERGLYCLKELLLHCRLPKDQTSATWKKFQKFFRQLLKLCWYNGNPERAVFVYSVMYEKKLVSSRWPPLQFVKSFVMDERQVSENANSSSTSSSLLLSAMEFYQEMRKVINPNLMSTSFQFSVAPEEIDDAKEEHKSLRTHVNYDREKGTVENDRPIIFKDFDFPLKACGESLLELDQLMSPNEESNNDDTLIGGQQHQVLSPSILFPGGIPSDMRLDMSLDTLEKFPSKSEDPKMQNLLQHIWDRVYDQMSQPPDVEYTNETEEFRNQKFLHVDALLDEGLDEEKFFMEHANKLKEERGLSHKKKHLLEWKPVIFGVDNEPFFPKTINCNEITEQTVTAAKMEYLDSILDPEVKKEVSTDVHKFITLMWIDKEGKLIKGLEH